jgi:hypothetical protein
MVLAKLYCASSRSIGWELIEKSVAPETRRSKKKE